MHRKYTHSCWLIDESLGECRRSRRAFTTVAIFRFYLSRRCTCILMAAASLGQLRS